MFHQLMLVGNAGRDAEARYTDGGDLVTTFSLAVDNSYNKKDGSRVKRTLWFRVQAWGKLAEVCQDYVKKGTKVLVLGKLMSNEEGTPKIWNNAEGLPRANFDVSVSYLRLLGSKEEEHKEEHKEEQSSDDFLPY